MFCWVSASAPMVASRCAPRQKDSSSYSDSAASVSIASALQPSAAFSPRSVCRQGHLAAARISDDAAQASNMPCAAEAEASVHCEIGSGSGNWICLDRTGTALGVAASRSSRSRARCTRCSSASGAGRPVASAAHSPASANNHSRCNGARVDGSSRPAASAASSRSSRVASITSR